MRELIQDLPATFVHLWQMCVAHPLGAVALLIAVVVAVVVSG